MTPADLKTTVRDKYAEAARQAQAGSASSCCDSTCCGTSSAADPISTNLYTPEETACLPESAVLASLGCGVTVVPARTPAEAVLEMRPHGVFLSNGPGDPEAVPYLVESVRGLVGRTPIFGICLGNQILGLALGGKTYKLKFGHHGANHPVRDLSTGRVEITAQNHGFSVDPTSVAKLGLDETHVNLNDGTSEGMRHRELPIFSVQYHPEASPGPHDAHYLFHRFIDLMSGGKGE